MFRSGLNFEDTSAVVEEATVLIRSLSFSRPVLLPLSLSLYPLSLSLPHRLSKYSSISCCFQEEIAAQGHLLKKNLQM